MLRVLVHMVACHVNSGLAGPPYKCKPYPPFLCMQFNSQWDTHPDNRDQRCFINSTMRRGACVCGWCTFSHFSHSWMGRTEGEVCVFPGKYWGSYSREWRDTIRAFLACWWGVVAQWMRGAGEGVWFGLSTHSHLWKTSTLSAFCCINNRSRKHLWLHEDYTTIATFTINNTQKSQKLQTQRLWSCLELDLSQWAGYLQESGEEGATEQRHTTSNWKTEPVCKKSLQKIKERRRKIGAWANGLQVIQYKQELRACRGISLECWRTEPTVNMTPEAAAEEMHMQTLGKIFILCLSNEILRLKYTPQIISQVFLCWWTRRQQHKNHKALEKKKTHPWVFF